MRRAREAKIDTPRRRIEPCGPTGRPGFVLGDAIPDDLLHQRCRQRPIDREVEMILRVSAV
jgi:hypothetical protein